MTLIGIAGRRFVGAVGAALMMGLLTGYVGAHVPTTAASSSAACRELFGDRRYQCAGG